MSGSFVTTAAVLGVSGIIRFDSKTVFFLLYIRKHHINPVSDLHCSKVTTTTSTLLYFTYLLQLSFHTMAVVLTLVQMKQIRINIHK